jgi:Nitrile hydratase beta subunit, N-terminal
MRERPPAEYLSKTYYQVWLAGLQQLLVERGLVAPVWARPLARCQRFTVSVDAFEPYLEPAR